MRIALLTIDGLQPAYLGPYGCEWIATPTFDRWAAHGVVFDCHFADVPRSAPPLQPTHAALGGAVLSVDVATTDRRGAKAALRKAAKRESALVHIAMDALQPPWKLTADDLAPFFEDAGDLDPWLDPLPTEIEPDDDATFARLQATYAAAVARLDVGLSELDFEGFTLIVTSGRGLPLGEHGAVGHPAPLYEELVHVPLIVVAADGAAGGQRVRALTQPMDVAATIGAAFGIALPSGDPLTTGRNLWLPHVETRTHAVTIDGDRAAIRTADWHWLAPHGDEDQQLFVKPDDRWDVNNVAQHHAEQCDELRAHLLRFAPGERGF